MTRSRLWLLGLALLTRVASGQSPVVTFAPTFAPAAFANGHRDHPLFPLAPGAVFVYALTEDGKAAVDSIVVTARTAIVAGVRAAVVHDRVVSDGLVREDTFDWFAIDSTGTVWYLGEDTRARHGGTVSTAGSWRAGAAHAVAGIIMPAHPRVGDTYRQEYRRGVAEDLGRVISVDDSLTVAAGHFAHCVTTEDWSPLEPAVRERKSYCPGVGLVRETTVAGGTDHMELVSRSTQ